MKKKIKTKKQFLANEPELHKKIPKIRTVRSKPKYSEKVPEELFKKITRAKQEWESTIDSLPEIICLVDNKECIVRANRSIETWHLGKVTEIKGRKIHQVFHPGCKDSSCYFKSFWKQARKKAVQGQSVQYGTYDKILKRHIYLQTHPWKNWREKTTSNFMVIRVQDITEHKKIEHELQETNAFLRNILESSSNVTIISTDLEHNILYWNQGAENILGYKSEEMLGRNIDILYGDGNSKEMVKKIRSGICGTKKGISCDIVEKTKDGREVWVSMNLTPRFNDRGQVIGILGVGKDITGRRKAEEEKEKLQAQVIAQSRLVSVGELASGLVHEIGNPLQAILGGADLLLRDNKSEELQIIKEAGLHCKKIIEDLLYFTRQRKLSLNQEDINEILEKTFSLYGKHPAARKIKIIKKCNKLPYVNVSASHIEQVFLNLIINATKAMPDGGTLTITTTDHRSPITDHRKSDFIDISFKDTGVGISKENLPRVFEPFFTTREKGTGLGLSVSYGIIKQHGGEILVFSDGDGKGTEFVVRLPVRE